MDSLATDPGGSPPPGSWAPLRRIARLTLRPLEKFLRIQAASGIVLLLATAVALIWANSPWVDSYHALWHLPVGVRFGDYAFERPLEWVVNDGLMAIFFFVVGMEIRREIDHGELSELRRAALPLACALGGMVAPALLYLSIAHTPEAQPGWGAPMATDIAFALGVLALLSNRVPAALRVLLLALAVIDDLGAIVVIALFYSAGISLSGVAVAAGGVVIIFALKALGVRNKFAYIVPGIVVWAGTYAAGVHPTIAGVIVGMMTPVTAWRGPEGFLRDASDAMARLTPRAGGLLPHELHAHLHTIEVARREAISPAESLIEGLHPWVAFGIMPVFALANAGVELGDLSIAGDGLLVALGTTVGLLIGKPLGVLLAGAIAVKTGIAKLPAGLGARHIVVLGVVAGIGFTMALFIAGLAFEEPDMLGAAKLGVMIASALAMIVGLALGRALLPICDAEAANTADEAEASTEL
jgi:NhaA family Na+:H+ antiporter